MAIYGRSYYSGSTSVEAVNTDDCELINKSVLNEYNLTINDPSNIVGNYGLITKSQWDIIGHPNVTLRSNPAGSKVLRVCDLNEVTTTPATEPAITVANSSWTSYGLGNSEYPNATCRFILFEDQWNNSGMYTYGLMHAKYLDYTDSLGGGYTSSDIEEAYYEFWLRLEEFARNHTFSAAYGTLNSACGQNPYITGGVYNNGQFPYYEYTFALETAQQERFLYNLTDNEGDKLTYWARNSDHPRGGQIGCIIVCQWGSVSTSDSFFKNFKLWGGWRSGKTGWTFYVKQQTMSYYNGTGGSNYSNSNSGVLIDCTQINANSLSRPWNLGCYVDLYPNKSYVGNDGIKGPVVIAFIPNFPMTGNYLCLFHKAM